jgi:hypothetical protein
VLAEPRDGFNRDEPANFGARGLEVKKLDSHIEKMNY